MFWRHSPKPLVQRALCSGSRPHQGVRGRGGRGPEELLPPHRTAGLRKPVTHRRTRRPSLHSEQKTVVDGPSPHLFWSGTLGSTHFCF